MQISKTEYMMFLKQPAWLWLKKHDRGKLPLPDAALQAMFDEGHLFEEYAEQLFPGALKLGFSNYSEYLSLPERTMGVLKNGTSSILQGRFETGSITCIVDVLVRIGDNEYDLFEIKSSTGIKPEHEYDLAFQVVVLQGLGMKVRSIGVIYVNGDYVRRGTIDAQAITQRADVTERVMSLLSETKENIQQALHTVAKTSCPSLSPRFAKLESFREWLSIYKTIRTDLPQHSIYHLTALKASQIAELEDLGIHLIKDIPDTIQLSAKQRRQVEATKRRQRAINEREIQSFIQSVAYPVYFLDYETLSSVIPPFDGTRPYQQIPFQYSLHILNSPDGELVHREYIHTEKTNPVPALLTHLKTDIGETGTIFAWYESFEKGRNTEMGNLYPEYAAFLQQTNNRIVDLMTPFSSGWFVDKDFFGSSSIKKVLPVLVSELSYEKLAIQEGATAQRAWMDAVLNGKKANDKEQIISDLRTYCQLDTLAMVEIFNVLRGKKKNEGTVSFPSLFDE